MLADPSGALGDLRGRTADYPPALGAALVRGLWEADFCLEIARKGVAGGDPAYVAGCLFRAVGVACHALHGHAGAWLVNEKGMVAASGRLPAAPVHFAARAQALFADAGVGPLAAAAKLVGEIRESTRS